MAKYVNPYKMSAGAFIPRWLSQRSELGHGSKLTYAWLSYHARRSGWSWPSQELLADELGVSTRQVKTYVDNLRYFKLIEVVRPGLQKTNRYRFLNHDWMHPGVDEEPGDDEPTGFALRESEESSTS